MSDGVFELTIIVIIAACFGIIARLLKQPLVLAYIFTGIIIGVFGFFHLVGAEIFKTFSELGVMFLLFLIGLEINYTSLRLVGKPSLIVGIGQIIFTFIIGFIIGILFGFDYLSSAYISTALTFSSTIIVIKLLSEKGETNSLYGRISVGLLLIQDLVVILLLIFLAGIETSKEFLLADIVLMFFKGVVFFALMLWLGRKIIPLVFHRINRSHELLFLTSLAWCFVIAATAAKIGFSVEIGGFLAGLALANSAEHFQVSSRIKSLRDFFILIFFVILGSSFVFSDFSGLTWQISVFSLFVLIGNPLIVLIIMGIMGYRKRTSFLCGVTIAQISEFSLVLAAMGLKIGHITVEVASLITAVGIITITVSTYMIVYADTIFKILSPYLSIFERRRLIENGSFDGKDSISKPIILIGAHRTGQSISFHIPKENILIIDSDPEVITQLRRQKYSYVFGDISDSDIFEKINFSKSKLIISTSPQLEDNLMLLNELKSLKKKGESGAKIILRGQSEKEAEILYREGADYVLLPHFTSGQYLGKTIAIDPEMRILEQLKKRDLELMDKINYKE